ncbi:uncharacterized protein [Paralichthys olivaceus]|uniref:uncharacterized protein n=1 Tax=Paralichthys olivaceus TaxID=8255 RepID=UPI003751C4F2
MKQQNVVENELLRPEAEIKALKEELKKKDRLIKREKRQARTTAHINSLAPLTVSEMKLESCEAQCDALKASHLLELTQVEETWGKKVEVLQDENAALKDTSNRLTSEKTKLEDKARKMDAFSRSLWKQRKADTNALISSARSLTVYEEKLKSSEAQCDALKASHLLELTQVEETWGKRVEVLQDENAALKETSNRLTSEKTKLEDKARKMDAFLQRLWKEENADSKALISSACSLTVLEKKLESSEAQCEALRASHLLELTQVEESWIKKVEVLQEQKAAQKEKELKSCEAQCEALRASHLLELTQVEESWIKKVEVLQEQKAAQKEKELKSCEAQCDALKASHLLELTQVEESWIKKVEVLQEQKAAQKEKELKSCEAQCDALKASHLLELTQVEEIWIKKVEVLQEQNAAQKEELMSCEAQCDALKANHLLELTQVEESWIKKVEDVTAEDVALEDMVTLLNKEKPEFTQKDSEPQLEMEAVKEEDKPEVTESKPHEEKKKKRGKKWWKKLFKD